MTLHEKLLAATVGLPAFTPLTVTNVNRPINALRAVVELHKPGEIVTIGDKGKVVATRLWCPRCRTSSPCEEINVIAEQLDVTP